MGRVHASALAFLLIAASLLLPATARAWQASPPSDPRLVTTQQWILERAVFMARAAGVDWVDLAVARDVVDDPDTRVHDFRYHSYDRWGSVQRGQAPRRVGTYFDLMRRAVEAGNTDTASRQLAMLTHYFSDACEPLHTDNSRAERRVHQRFERAVARLLNRSSGGALRRVASRGPATVLQENAGAFTVRSATAAHGDYRRLIRSFRRDGLRHTSLLIAERALSRAVDGVAGMVVAVTTAPEILGAAPAPVTAPASVELVSQRKMVAASSQDAVYHPACFANDGDARSRWTPLEASYPQWWQVDLGASFDVARVAVDWFKDKDRAYTYTVQTSDDGVTWSTAVDRSGTATSGDTLDYLQDLPARYLRIDVLGYADRKSGSASTTANSAAIAECRVYGRAHSDEQVEPTPSPTPSPSSTAIPTESPTPTPTASATPTPSPTPSSASTITVTGTSASAVDQALSEAESLGGGAEVYFPAGTYSHGTLTLEDGISIRGAGIASTRLDFSLVFGSDQNVSKMRIGTNPGVALTSRSGATARNTTFSEVRFRGGGPIPGRSYSASSTSYTNYNPVVQLGGNDTTRSLSHVTFNDCEFERPAGTWVSRYVRANTISIWEDNRAGYAHIEYLTFNRCHFSVKNAAGEFGSLSANVELKTNSYGDGSFDHNWHDVVLRDCIVERSGDFNLDFTDAARSYLRAMGRSESGTTDGIPNWRTVPLQYRAGVETGRSVSVIRGQIKGAGYYYSGWSYAFCLENPIAATMTGVRIWGGNRSDAEPESASAACGPILGDALPVWILPLAYDGRGMNAVYGNTYTPDTWGSYTPSPYDP